MSRFNYLKVRGKRKLRWNRNIVIKLSPPPYPLGICNESISTKWNSAEYVLHEFQCFHESNILNKQETLFDDDC